MDQPPAVDFTAFIDVWPRATGNGDRRRPTRHLFVRLLKQPLTYSVNFARYDQWKKYLFVPL